ncbi:hypothetical protein F7734_46155 [Scytonema sp. UIC 10036]|uniref:hypothetical protein n=1 Tax=Scytonema sp. UIC 10036 TaxID=2304196 RepID=UPI0012DA7CDB|nr:hypothetical protein [Scytonema sp. UIC 10036]MUG99285.1 hypothetical protein [Scytonema sp. UIC 10036]
MSLTERQIRIGKNLGIRPISHGQVYTYQIAVAESEKQSISIERLQLIEDSLIQHKSNLMPLIVRRTEAYSEEEEYEVIYGADWCLVAKELDIEKLWVWVYDMTDEQASAAKEEMQQLLVNSVDENDISALIDQKLKPIYSKLNQVTSTLSSNTEKSNFDHKFTKIENQLQHLVSIVEAISVRIDELFPPPRKLNLVTAKEKEIDSALEKAGIYFKQRTAVLEAIKYWQNSGKILTWQNLKTSST